MGAKWLYDRLVCLSGQRLRRCVPQQLLKFQVVPRAGGEWVVRDAPLSIPRSSLSWVFDSPCPVLSRVKLNLTLCHSTSSWWDPQRENVHLCQPSTSESLNTRSLTNSLSTSAVQDFTPSRSHCFMASLSLDYSECQVELRQSTSLLV